MGQGNLEAREKSSEALQDLKDKKMELTWNTCCQESIREERIEGEKRYGIKITQTQIHCTWCGKLADFFHTCSKMDPERKAEIEKIQAEFNGPALLWEPAGWRAELAIELGMTKDQALEKFLEWQGTKKTCQRCEGEKYWDYCPIRLICKEANNVRNDAQRDVDRGRTAETPESEAVRAQFSAARERASIRQAFHEEAGVSGR